MIKQQMQQKQKKAVLLTAGILLILTVILTAGCVGPDNSGQPGVELVVITSGLQLNSLALGQTDAAVNWQPGVAAAEVSGVGKVISFSQDLPRPDKKTWNNHPCCVFGANEQGVKNKDLAVVLTALLMKANQYITDNPKEAAADAANWIYGDTDPVYGNITVKGFDVINTSIPTIHFTTEMTDEWKDSVYDFIQIYRSNGTFTGTLKSESRRETEMLIYEPSVYQAAKEAVQTGIFPVPVSEDISIGYLLSDHDSPLFVLVKNWEFFRDNGNTYLKPAEEKSGQTESAELYVNGKKICNVSFVQGNAGPNLTTMMQTGGIQYAIAGLTPYLCSIDVRKGLKILSPVMNEGSGLIVPADAPVNSWKEFATWAKQRSADGKKLLIAVPEVNSIQDLILKYALAAEGIAFAMKGA